MGWKEGREKGGDREEREEEGCRGGEEEEDTFWTRSQAPSGDSASGKK